MKAQSSTLPNVNEIAEKWYHVDAEGLIVGRLATRVASLVRGKLEPGYAPHLDHRIHVVITNADKVVFTGNKLQDKVYYHHSGWRTGIKSITADKLMQKDAPQVLEKAIYGMLPKNRLGRKLNKHVHIYAGAEHPHEAQQPTKLEIKTRQPKSSS